MIRSKNANLTMLAVFVTALVGILFFQYGVGFLEMGVQQVLSTLISTGKGVASELDAIGLPGLAIFVIGNIFLSCLVFFSTKFYSFLRGKKRPVRVVIATLTLLLGLALMVVQAGFCLGFAKDVISEGLKNFSTILFSIQGMLLSFAPLYYSMKADHEHPLTVPGEHRDQRYSDFR